MTGPTPPLDLDALEAVLAKATPGEWRADGRYVGTPNHMSYVAEVSDQNGNWSDTAKSTGDAAAIVALHNAAPALIAELRASRTALAAGEVELREALAKAEARTSGIFEALEAAVEQFSEPMSLLNAHELGKRLASDVAEIARHGRARTALAALSPPPELVVVEVATRCWRSSGCVCGSAFDRNQCAWSSLDARTAPTS